MHMYLRAVGFRNDLTKKKLEELLKETVEKPDKAQLVEQGDTVFAQLERQCGDNFGICVCGEFDKEGTFDMEFYYPVFYGEDVTTYEKPSVERHAAQESYAGLCDDFRVGISIIFFVNNTALYRQTLTAPVVKGEASCVILSALASEGRILLPLNKTKKQREAEQEAVKQRSKLITAAKQGDEKAIESLTLEDLDTFSMVGRRIGKEDVLTIVESYFMPRGIECDQYTVLGEIVDWRQEKNCLTQEEVCILTINCNDMILNVCINREDLLGTPEIGRRLKADIWLQGTLCYEY